MDISVTVDQLVVRPPGRRKVVGSNPGCSLNIYIKKCHYDVMLQEVGTTAERHSDNTIELGPLSLTPEQVFIVGGALVAGALAVMLILVLCLVCVLKQYRSKDAKVSLVGCCYSLLYSKEEIPSEL